MASAKITVSKNFTSLKGLVKVPAEDMREIGLLARELIVRRTLQGIDAKGASFAPYSEGYAKEKRQALGSASPVNLQVSGNMLNDIAIVAVAENKVTLGWVK